MAKLLAIDGPFYEISNLINESKSFLILVSPYINLTGNQLRELRVAANRGVEITIVFRSFESCDDALKRSPFLDVVFEIPNLKTISCPDLHAKIYVNENRAILTSKNLYERDEGSSIEVGVRFYKGADDKMYDELFELAKEITRFNDCETIIDNIKTGRKRRIPRYPKEGFCIRCRDRIPFNPERPYCPQCHDDWKYGEGGDKYIPERFCHRCGMRQPMICKKSPQDNSCSYNNQ